jgi:nitrile hydratase accessory protein
MSDPRTTLADIAAQCRGTLPLPTGAADAPVFAEPWQAQAFAMAVQLHAKGVFTWPQWAQTLSQTIANARASGDPDDGSGYYQHWVDALEHLVLAQNLGTAEQIHRFEHAWEAAAARTRHGEPIEVQAKDFGPQMGA